MATMTTNYGFTKPAEQDFYNIGDFNKNADIMDGELKKLDEAVQAEKNTVVVNLPLSGWSAAAPYTIRVAVPGVKAADNPELKVYTPKTLDAATVKLRQKLTGMITDGMTENGYVTLYCGVKKPTADFVVLLKGVSVNE